MFCDTSNYQGKVVFSNIKVLDSHVIANANDCGVLWRYALRRVLYYSMTVKHALSYC